MNKKAMGAPETLATFILVFLLVFGLIILYGKVVKGNTQILQCNANGGQCVTGTCDWGSQVPALSDKAAGCKSGQLCCINISQSTPIDPICENETLGFKCGSLQYCSAAKTCISKCEFCQANSDYESICGKSNVYETGVYKCRCTLSQCQKGTNINDGNCIPNYCPSKDSQASDYMWCCNEKVD